MEAAQLPFAQLQDQTKFWGEINDVQDGTTSVIFFGLAEEDAVEDQALVQ